MNGSEIDPAMAAAAVRNATALASPKTEAPWPACKAKPVTRRLRSMTDAIRKTILQVDPCLLDQLCELEQRQRETVQRIAGAFRQ